MTTCTSVRKRHRSRSVLRWTVYEKWPWTIAGRAAFRKLRTG